MRLLATTLLILLASLPAAAAADPYTAPGNKVLWGGQGGYKPGAIGEFARQSGKHPAVFNYFITGAATSTGSGCGLRTPSARTPGRCCRCRPRRRGSRSRDLARGGGDGFLVGLNRLLAEHGQVVYLRPLSEMNNANNPYSAYDQSGRSRGPAFTTTWFKNAWRRLALVVRGGDVATINSKLRRLRPAARCAPAPASCRARRSR